MERNEIYKAYGTDFPEMTELLLEKADLTGEIRRKAEALGIEPSAMRIAIKLPIIKRAMQIANTSYLLYRLQCRLQIQATDCIGGNADCKYKLPIV